MVVLEDCKRHGVSIVRFLQMISDPQKGPMPGLLALNLSSPILGVLGPMDGGQAAAVGHIAMVYNMPMIAVRGAITR